MGRVSFQMSQEVAIEWKISSCFQRLTLNQLRSGKRLQFRGHPPNVTSYRSVIGL